MRIQTEYMSFRNCWTISSSYDFQAHHQPSQRGCCFSQTPLLWFKVLPDMSPALSGLWLALPELWPGLPGAPRLVIGTPRLVFGSPRLVVGTPRLVAGASSFSECLQECPPRVWYFPEIDTSKFSHHILSDTPGGFQWLKYILLICVQHTN